MSTPFCIQRGIKGLLVLALFMEGCEANPKVDFFIGIRYIVYVSLLAQG